MTEQQIFVEPTYYQRGVGLLLGVILILITMRMIKNFKLKEEHALPWLAGGAFLVLLCFSLPVLKFFTKTIGAGAPTTALFAGALFFLIVQSLCLTSTVSRQKRQIQGLVIELALQKNFVKEQIEQEMYENE